MILGISFDTESENAAFKKKFEFPFDLLCDVDRTVSMAYGAADSADAEYPSRISYLIGPTGRVKQVYAKVKPAGHPDEVLRDLG